jgi:hypothetical protein
MTVKFTVLMTEAEAWELAQFLKRAGFSDFRSKTRTDDEAYTMQSAAEKVADALRDVGYAPR